MKKNYCPHHCLLVRAIYRWPVDSPFKGPATWEAFPCDVDIMFFHGMLHRVIICSHLIHLFIVWTARTLLIIRSHLAPLHLFSRFVSQFVLTFHHLIICVSLPSRTFDLVTIYSYVLSLQHLWTHVSYLLLCVIFLFPLCVCVFQLFHICSYIYIIPSLFLNPVHWNGLVVRVTALNVSSELSGLSPWRPFRSCDITLRSYWWPNTLAIIELSCWDQTLYLIISTNHPS